MLSAERIAPVDTTWLRMDRPANPMVITGLLVVEGPVDVDKLEETILGRLLRIPRFRQRVEMRSGEYWWVEVADIERRRHIKRVRLPGQGGRTELQDYVSDLASEPTDKSRPLWQMRIVEHYEGGAAVIMRFHHAIGDGIALVGVILSLTDEGSRKYHAAYDSGRARRRVRPWLSVPGLGTIQQGLQLSREVLERTAALAANPASTIRTGAGVAGELAYLLLMPDDTPTRFKGKPEGDKRVAWTSPIPLPEVKAVSQALGCSINDMLLGSAAGALGQYLRDKGDPTNDVEIRALVPVNMRTEAEAGLLGNRFGIVGVELPLGIEDPIARLKEVRERMLALKHSLEPAVTLGLLSAVGHTPKLLQDRLFNLLLSRATAVMTNVPGPQHALHFGGMRIKEVMFWVPQSGDIGMGLSILSFDGMVQFGLMTDAALVPDPEAIVAHFRPEFEQLLYYALLKPWELGQRERASETRAKFPRPPSQRQREKPARAVRPASRTPNRGSARKSSRQIKPH
jgi:WS/DGAT/MGAT family acyltransferase